MTTTTTAPPAPALDPPEQTLHEEIAAIEAGTGWTLWLSEDGGVWMQAVTGITRWAQTPALARHAIAVWEHEAGIRCQLPPCASAGCTHDQGSHWDGTGACGFCGCGSWTVAA